MARQPQLTVNVNSQQFQNFAKQFNAFSGQIKQLNQQFAQINAQLNKTNILVRGINSTMTGLLNITKSVGSEVWKITKNFISWSTIIGSITALLGMGGGLFGIERLAASILAKRRMVLGLGGDYGRTQASMIFSQGLIGSPQNVLQNIAMGMGGAPDQMKTLLAMGVPFGSKMDPDEVMDKIVEKLPDILKRGGPGTELMTARAYGLDKIFTDPMDLLRLSTEEGRKEYQMKRELTKQYEEQMKITPKALRAWTELELQFQAAKATLESAFGNRLADLAEPLKHLSEGFTQLIRTLMDTPVVKQLIKDLAGWIDQLADKMKNLTQDDINNFIEQIKGWLPTMEEFKAAMKDFVEILQGAVEVLKFLRHPVDYFKENILPRAYEPADQTPIGGPAPTPGGATPSSIAKGIGDWLKRPMFGGGGAWSGVPTTSGGGLSVGAAGSAAPGFQSFGGPGGGFGGGVPQTAQGSSGFGWLQSVPGMQPPQGAWSGAASRMVPQNTGGKGGVVDPSQLDRTWKGNRLGALDTNNWQMNRTANLVVRNVPGSNVFLTAAGMTA